MVADDIVFWFSVIVVICVAIWAFLMIRAYNRVSKDK